MRPLSYFRQQLADIAAFTSRMVVPAASLRLDAGARLSVEEQTFALSRHARGQLARRASVPAGFLEKCPEDLQAAIFNRLYPQALEQRPSPEMTSLVVRNGELVVGLTDPDLVSLYGEEVLEIALTARPKEVDENQLEVDHYHLNGDLRLSIVSPQIESKPRVGDIIRAGIDILHSDTGVFGTQISSFMLRLACSNGMLARICRHDSGSRARVRRAVAENKELTRLRIKEMAQTAWGELRAKMVAVEQLAKERVDNPAELIRAIGEKLRLTDRLVREIIGALDEDELGRSGTLWDVVSAVSRIGTHSARLSSETRRYFQELSGDLIEERVTRCPTCGAVRRAGVRYLPRR